MKSVKIRIKIIAWFLSLFTKIPQPTGNFFWYYRKGRRISKYNLFLEEHLEMIDQIKDRIENKPNINCNE